jgi:hypothetical protein
MNEAMKEKVIVSSFTLVTSLTGYFYAKGAAKDVVPYMMVTGFIGAILGEAIAQTFCKDDKNKPNKPK